MGVCREQDTVAPVSGPHSCLKMVPLLMGPLWCLPPLDSPERIFGGISSSQSSVRTPMRRAATLEKTWRMSNRSGKPRNIISINTRRMVLALLALSWIRQFKALTLTTLQHRRLKSFTCTSMADQRRYVPYQEASPA